MRISEAESIRSVRLRASMLVAEAELNGMPIVIPRIEIDADIMNRLIEASRGRLPPNLLKEAEDLAREIAAGHRTVRANPYLLIKAIDVAAPEMDKADVTMRF